MGHLVRAEGRGVVGADLVTAGTMRSRAIEITRDNGGEGAQVLTVIRAGRGAHNREHCLGIRNELHLRMHAEKKRTKVKRSLVAVRRQEL